jgi:hypothetical protein
MRYRDWRDLPFHEIWVVDTEFFPGAGFANGGVNGDPLTPLCLVALELRSGRLIRQWQHELGAFPPYKLSADSLLITYMAAAEFGFHLARRWGEPACAIDAYLEFRHFCNNGAAKAEDRGKGFYSIDGALRYFGIDATQFAHDKDASRDRILQGPPFSESEQRELIGYCEDDVRKLALLVPHIVPTIRSLPHAMFRARFQWVTAEHERRGIPVNRPQILRFRHNWDRIKLDLVGEMDRPFRCYEVVNGKVYWRNRLFEEFRARRHDPAAGTAGLGGAAWPQLDSGAHDLTVQTFREMAGRFPQLEPLRELRYSLSKLRLNALAIGADGRNRASLWAYGTKTGRNAPGASEYIFGPAKWIRHFIEPPPGRCLVHRDYSQQEVRIAAVISNDPALLAACAFVPPGESAADVYLGIAHELGFLRESMNADERVALRALFKTVVLGIQYGLGWQSLAIRTGIAGVEAREILARLRARFRAFEMFSASVLDHAGLELEIRTPFGWHMRCPPGINPRTVRNFPVQSTGSEILHVACLLAPARGINIVAPVHDALMAEGDLADAEDLSRALDKLMGDAAETVLRGHRLPTDTQIIRPGETYQDKRGAEMWAVITRLMAKLEQEAA